MRERGRIVLTVARALVVLAVAVIALTAASVPDAAGAYAPLPVGDDQTFLSSVNGADLSPGGSGSITFVVGDPSTFQPITEVGLTLDVYAFNAFPGNATSSLLTAAAPVLVTATTSSTTANLSLGPLLPGTHEEGSVGVATAANTPTGTFAVRTQLNFVANGTSYRLESRGWFTASQWAAATQLPNGSLTLNLSALGVSGVTAETSVLVSSSNWDWALAVILGVSVVFVGAGAYVYFRRESKSRSGAR